MKRLSGDSSSIRGAEHTLLFLTLFVVAAVVSGSLLLLALVLFVAELLGSLLCALIVVGVVMLCLSIAIYHFGLRPVFVAVREQLQTIYEVSALAQLGYNWVVSKVDQFAQRLFAKNS